MKNIFDSLDKEDYFGYISLESGSRFEEAPLEKKGKNQHIKKAFLQSKNRPDEVTDFLRNRSQQDWKLQHALQMALDWQDGIENTSEYINGYQYVGPHKWIVCLIGSTEYTVQLFLAEKRRLLQETPNLSISVVALTERPLTHRLRDYKELTMDTREGNFINIVDVKKYDAHQLGKAFFSSLDVYPGDKRTSIREFFHT